MLYFQYFLFILVGNSLFICFSSQLFCFLSFFVGRYTSSFCLLSLFLLSTLPSLISPISRLSLLYLSPSSSAAARGKQPGDIRLFLGCWLARVRVPLLVVETVKTSNGIRNTRAFHLQYCSDTVNRNGSANALLPSFTLFTRLWATFTLDTCKIKVTT